MLAHAERVRSCLDGTSTRCVPWRAPHRHPARRAQVLDSAPVVASQLLLVDEVIRAGMNMRKG